MNYWPRPPSLKAIFLVQLGTFFNLSERKEMSVNIAEVFQQGIKSFSKKHMLNWMNS